MIVMFLPLENVINKNFYRSSNVFLNGKLVGIHYEPIKLVQYLKLLKLNSFINITTSISWNIQSNGGSYFLTDSGRIVRPGF